MCVIVASPAGAPQPSESTLRACFRANPHGAGYMRITQDGVEIRKGFMTCPAFLASVRAQSFTAADPVIYHFRISTQAGVNPAMCHPFPLTREPDELAKTRCTAQIGVAHNGIIREFSTGDRKFSDTALYITGMLSHLIRNRADLHDPAILRAVELTAPGSKFAFLDCSGRMEFAGKFTELDGIFYSNTHWMPRENYGAQCEFTERWPFDF